MAKKKIEKPEMEGVSEKPGEPIMESFLTDLTPEELAALKPAESPQEPAPAPILVPSAGSPTPEQIEAFLEDLGAVARPILQDPTRFIEIRQNPFAVLWSQIQQPGSIAWRNVLDYLAGLSAPHPPINKRSYLWFSLEQPVLVKTIESWSAALWRKIDKRINEEREREEAARKAAQKQPERE